MDQAIIRAQLPTLIRAFIPRNCKTSNCRFYDGQPKVSILGFYVDPKPFEGRVVAKTEEAIIVKTKGKRADFAVLDRALATEDPGEGAQVEVQPYARRRFDGLRADTPKEETHIDSSGRPYTIQTHILGTAPAKLPIPEPCCSKLRQLIEHLETLSAPDGFRQIAHLLVDAGARDFSWVDPVPEDIVRTPPAISFTVATEKFAGRVRVLYEASFDLYAVELYRDDAMVARVDCVAFVDLGKTLEGLIDDGSWRRIRVNIL